MPQEARSEGPSRSHCATRPSRIHPIMKPCQKAGATGPLLAATLSTLLAAQSAPAPAASVRGAPAQASPWVRAPGSAEVLSYEIPFAKTSRIAVADERIESAVFDRSLVSVQTDSRLGQIFVEPLAPGDASIYLTTESGATIALVVTAVDGADPQNIVLTRRPGAAPSGTDNRSARMLRPLPVSDYESGVKRLVRQMIRGEESPDVMRRGACPRASASLAESLRRLSALNPVVRSCWSTAGMDGALVLVRNTRLGPARIDEAAIGGRAILAVAVERRTLNAGETALIAIVEPGHGD